MRTELEMEQIIHRDKVIQRKREIASFSFKVSGKQTIGSPLPKADREKYYNNLWSKLTKKQNVISC